MKKAPSIPTVILILATFIALIITIYVGGFNKNSFTFYFNTILINITFMGDAFFAFGIVFFLLFFFNKKHAALKLLITVLISLSITQAIKIIFSGLPPQLFFEEGVLQSSGKVFSYRNIISSHTSIAFTLASFFLFYTKNMMKKVLFIVLAIIVAFTRMKLAGDSSIALVLGILPAIAASFYLYKIKQKSKTSKYAYYYNGRKESKRSVGKQFLRV